MALIRCNECGGKVSDSAKVCPHCGKEIDLDECIMDNAIKRSEWNKKRRIVILILAIIGIIACCFFVRYMRIKGEERELRELGKMLHEIQEKNENDEEILIKF